MRTLTKKQKIAAIIIACVLAIALIVMIVINAVRDDWRGKTPVSSDFVTVTIELDSGASISLRLNSDDYTTISASTLNADDYKLSDNLGENIPYKQAADKLIKNFISAEIISGQADQTILFSVESLDETDFNAVCSVFKDAMNANNLETRIYTLYIKVKEDKIQKLADQNDISYAKAYFCTKLAGKGTDLKIEDLLDKTISEIIDATSSAEKNEEFVSSVVSDSNEEQVNTSIPEDVLNEASSKTEESSSQATSSDITSSEITSSGGPGTYPVVPDDSGWLPGVY